MHEPWLLAEVVLNVPLHSTFYYIIPKELQDQDIALKRVAVHFGRREDIGFVMRILKEEDVTTDLRDLKSVKEIESVLDAQPIFTSDLISLGETVAEYYHAPIGEVIFTMLPPLKEPKHFTNPYISDQKDFTPNEEQIGRAHV